MKSLNEVKQLSYERHEQLEKDYQELYKGDLKTIEDNFYKVFPNGKIVTNLSRSIGDPTLTIRMRLIGDNKDQRGGIVDNDPLGILFISHLPGADNPTKDTKIVLEKLRGNLDIKPEEGSFMAMEHVKLPFRKSTGTMKNQIAKIDKFVKQTGKTVLDNADNLYHDDINPKYLKINA